MTTTRNRYEISWFDGIQTGFYYLTAPNADAAAEAFLGIFGSEFRVTKVKLDEANVA